MKRLLTLTLLITLSLLPLNAQTDTNAESQATWVDCVTDWYGEHTNYGSIAALMAIESSFIPFPSEIIIPPAAYIASEEDSNLTVWGVILAGTMGALFGALVNYFLSLWLGRPIIYRLADSKVGHLLLLSGEKVQTAENYFNRHGKVSTLIGRLIPAVRQLISIPAGLAKMNLGAFVLFTTLGAGAWNIILALLGYYAHGQKELIHQYSRELSIILLVLFALFIIYLVIQYVRKKKEN